MGVDYAQPSKPVGWDRKLRDIHPRLSTHWNAPRRRWEIWYDSDRGMGSTLAIVVGDGFNYEPLSDRILDTLRAGDTHRIGPRAVCEIMEEGERAAEKAREKELSAVTEAAAREMADHTKLYQKPIGVRTETDNPQYARPKYRSSKIYDAYGRKIYVKEE